MNKKISDVRNSIIKRNKKRDLSSNKTEIERVTLPLFPETEEKHGYYPSFVEPSINKHDRGILFYNFILKGIISVVLFLGIASIQQSNLELFSKPKLWATNAMTNEFPFARVSVWYQDTFGTPLAYIPEDNLVNNEVASYALPVSGKVAETFQANGSGIMISPVEAASVTSWDKGVVIFKGNDRKTNKTVIIQHTDLSKSTYAYLSSIDVHLYQSVNANQRIGTFNPTATNELVYFSLEKDNEYMDPIQVIQVDDLP